MGLDFTLRVDHVSKALADTIDAPNPGGRSRQPKSDADGMLTIIQIKMPYHFLIFLDFSKIFAGKIHQVTKQHPDRGQTSLKVSSV